MQIGILGVGSMGGAIIQGLANKMDSNDIYAFNHKNERVSELSSQIGFHLLDSIDEFRNQKLDAIIATVPAPVTVAVLKQLNGISTDTIILSAAGGIRQTQVAAVLPDNPIVTIIPNTPVSVNSGTIAASFDTVSSEVAEKATAILSLLGDVVVTAEKNAGIAGTIGGCGPAFVDIFMDAMADAAVESGLDRATAYKIVASMVSGSGQLALQSGQTPATLKDAVTSPGGTTIQGVTELDAQGFRNAIIQAVRKSNGDM